MNNRPPVDDRAINGRRALVLLASTAVLIAAFLGYLFAPHEQLPTDPGTPATATTIGGSR